MALQWNAYTAFNGTLTAAFMRRTIAAGVVDNTADVLRLNQWLDALRAAPANHGIPLARVVDVQTLLNAFFPTGVLPVRMLDHQIAPPAPGRAANPVVVHFGPQNADMSIMDAPTALGYIFSVVTPDVAHPTWQNHYLPLLLLYARCTFLAFLPSEVGGMNIAGVPIMCSVMYATNAPLQVMYGSTWMNDASNAANQPLVAPRYALLDRWRLQDVLTTALPWIPHAGGAAAPAIPAYSPNYLNQLVDIFWRDLLGTGPMRRAALITVAAANAQAAGLTPGLQADINTNIPAPPQFPKPFPRAQLLVQAASKAQLYALTLNVLNLRLSPTYIPGGPLIVNALREMVSFYFLPHMYSTAAAAAPITPASVEIQWNNPAVPLMGATIAAAKTNLWNNPVAAPVGVAALARLNAFYQDVITVPDNAYRPIIPYGRCAETYPLVGMLPHYQTNDNMQNVHGMSVQARSLGASAEFDVHFSSDRANAVPNLYRYPCANCQTLLPIYHVPTGAAHYDLDMLAIPPLPQANPPR